MKTTLVKKKHLYARHLARIRQYALSEEDRAWEGIASVGREFGSQDYEQVVKLDEAHFPADRAIDSTD